MGWGKRVEMRPGRQGLGLGWGTGGLGYGMG